MKKDDKIILLYSFVLIVISIFLLIGIGKIVKHNSHSHNETDKTLVKINDIIERNLLYFPDKNFVIQENYCRNNQCYMKFIEGNKTYEIILRKIN
jgi:hypothetical protein